MAEKRPQFQNMYFNDTPTGLGQIMALGVHKDGVGTPRETLRVYGSYAIVLCLNGSAEYRDANGVEHKIIPGDLITVFPELPHRYATKPGHYWTECFLIFDGPVFDLCRTQGILNAACPIRHLDPLEAWQNKFEAIIQFPESHSPVEKAAEISRLLHFLMEVNPPETLLPHDSADAPWLSTAKSILDADLNTELDPKSVAAELGISYETFRKRFQQHLGVSPGRYRTGRRVAAASSLLRLTTLTHQQIAANLGFADEFHFSKRFKQIMGIGPREYRRQKNAAPVPKRPMD